VARAGTDRSDVTCAMRIREMESEKTIQEERGGPLGEIVGVCSWWEGHNKAYRCTRIVFT